MTFVPMVRGREMILYPDNFKGQRVTFATHEEASKYRELYYLGLYCSPFGGDYPDVITPENAPWGADDWGIAKLHPDDVSNPNVIRHKGKSGRKTRKRK